MNYPGGESAKYQLFLEHMVFRDKFRDGDLFNQLDRALGEYTRVIGTDQSPIVMLVT